MPLITLKKEQRVRRGPSEVIALDIASSGTKAVRVKRVKDSLTILGVDILPPFAYKAPKAEEPEKEAVKFEPGDVRWPGRAGGWLAQPGFPRN